MRLIRLDICGFKSFNEKATVLFDGGITAIVGPNGCGKSNVVDAIRWVMGEQSAKQLRGRAMGDVVFGGSAGQPPGGMAEVALTLQNDRPEELPPRWRGFAEITVARRLFSSGESDYSINKNPCRLLDVTELFLGTGVGTRAYGIIEQGRIGLIVNARPEDRRSILEEAAGITRYASRRRAAERKMEATEQNLLRVADVVSELQKRLDGLARAAKKAERYKKLKAEQREIDLHTAACRWLELQATSAAVGLARMAASGREEEAAARAAALGARIEGARGELAREDGVIAELSAKAHELDKEAARLAQETEFSGRERERLFARGEALAAEAKAAAARVEELSGMATALAAEREALAASLAGDETRLAVVETELAALAGAEEDLRRGMDEEAKTAAQAMARASAAASAADSLGKRREELSARIEAMAAQAEEAEARLREARRAGSEHEGLLAEARQLTLDLTARRGQAQAAMDETTKELAETESAMASAREEAAAVRSRLASLTELSKNHEGCERGVRAVLGTSGRPGVLGLVADILAVPASVEKAIEAVLGERLQHVVVEGREAALSAIRFLSAGEAGRATFEPLGGDGGPGPLPDPMPLDPIEPGAPGGSLGNGLLPASSPRPGVSHPGVVGAALDLVTTAPEHRSVAERLLSGILVVRDLDAANEIFAAGAGATLVTLAGEVLFSSGALAGGTLEGRGAGDLSWRREMGELSAAQKSLATRLAELAARRERLSARVRQLSVELDGIAEGTHAQAVSLAHREEDVRAAGEEASRWEKRIEALGAGRAEAAARIETFDGERAAAIETGRAAEEEAARRRALQEELSRGLAEARVRRERVAGERTELAARAAAGRERGRALAARAEETGRALAAARERIAVAGRESEEARERGEALANQAEACRAEGTRLAAALAGVREERERAAAAREEMNRGLTGLAAALEQARGDAEAARAELSDLTVRAKEQELEIDHLLRSIAERHDLDLLGEVARFHAVPAPGPEAALRMAELKEAIGRIGEVNLTAVEEHREIAERHAFLSAQKEDLEKSLAGLREAIARMNRTSRRRFRETFDLVNERFAQVFPRLFGGGKAELSLVEGGGDVLEAGVDIVVQPPGKKLSTIALLSGGEKALTAISLVFAIFLVKPSPFCMLDEVDAPLDENNIVRYNALVREMSRISQFVIITHNKRTMEVADTLYGVTMEEPGCSKLVSVRLAGREGAAA